MKEIVVVGAAIMDGKRVLAAQRSVKMNSPLKWEFPGGKVEEGETQQQALKREIIEELGIMIEVGEMLGCGIAEYGDKRITLNVYWASIVEGKPVAKEHADIRWIEIDRIGELEWAEPDIPVCKVLLKNYGSICWNYTLTNSIIKECQDD